MFSNLDFNDQVEVKSAIPAGAYTTAQATAAGIDVSGYSKVFVVVNYGTITDGTITPSITTSATLGGSYVADTDNILGTIVAGTSATDETCVVFGIDVKNSAQFVKVLLNETVASSGYDASATLVGVLKTV